MSQQIVFNPLTGKFDVVDVFDGTAAGGDLSGTYPNPSVTDDSHNHTTATLPATMPPSAHDIVGAAHTITASQYQVVGATAANTLGLVNASDLIVKDTRANILAMTATAGRFAYATDTYEFLIADGTNWRKVPFSLVSEPSAPDMGYTQGSSRIGYGTDYLTDKLIANSQIGSNAKTTLADGDIRVSSSTLQVYLSGAWKDIVTGFRLREDDSGYLVFEHKPTGMTEWLEINSGNSNTLGLNGLPMIQQYGASMGAYPVPLQVDGGTF